MMRKDPTCAGQCACRPVDRARRRGRWAITGMRVVVLALAAALGGAANGRTGELEWARQIVQQSGVPGGFCAVAGRSDAELALALATLGKFQVHALYAQEELCDRMRAAIGARGKYGTVSAAAWDGRTLPYTDNLINIVIVDSYPQLRRAGFSVAEAARVLVPRGTAWIGTSEPAAEAGQWIEPLRKELEAAGLEDVSIQRRGGTWLCAQKPWPAGIDQWTHYLHGPDGNPVAEDRVVGPPEHYQWVSGPLFLRSHETDSSISTVVTAEGRLFYIVDEAPISLAGNHPLPDKWFLAARDAFNGVDLWKVPIRQWGWRQWKSSWFTCRPGDFPLDIRKRLVAVGQRVYVTLGYDAPVSELDARTGALLKTYAGTEHASEILYIDGTLILPVLQGDRIRVLAVDAETGKQLWRSANTYRGSKVDYVRWRAMHGSVKPPAKTNPAPNAATDGRIVALIDGPEIVALDFRTGAERWRAAFPADPGDLTAGGIQSQGNLWNGTMIVRDGVVVHASPNKLAALSARDGKLLWSHPKKYIGHLWYEWKDVFVVGGLVWTWSAELDTGSFDIGRRRKQRERWPRSVNGYDLHTGKLVRSVPTGPIFKTHHHHRCYRNKATLRYILTSRRGTEFVDLEGGRHSVHNWVRGTCHVGMMPANGLQYVPPHPCQCYIDEKLNGFMALAPASAAGPKGEAEAQEAARLVRGPAYGRPAQRRLPDASAEDWPTFRHDGSRTGSAATRVPDQLEVLWRVAVGTKVSAPVVAAGRVFVARADQQQVVCLDAEDGRRLWEFAAGGRIDSPPTYDRGRVVFGSADGYVYCLDAADGQLSWRFQAAPHQRMIGAFGQLESAWPVHGSVLVQNGTAYFAAGRSSELDGGIYLYGLDVETGQVRCRTHLEGPDYVVDASGEKLVPESPPEPGGAPQPTYDVNYRLPMGCLPDILASDGQKIYMRSKAFEMDLEPASGTPLLRTQSGFLDGSYFKRMPWTFGGEYARLIVHDRRQAYYVRMFDTLRGLDPTVYFTPGAKGYLLFAKGVRGKRSSWMERVPVRVRAMVAAADRLFVAGPPDVLDPNDPLGAFEGRKGGLLYAIDATTGQRLAEYRLPSPPVFNGTAAARGRFYVVARDGSVACFGTR